MAGPEPAATPSPAAAPPVSSDPPAVSPDEQRALLNPAAGYGVPWERLPHYAISATLRPPVVAGQLTLWYPNTTGATLDSLVFRLFPNGQPIYTGHIEVSDVAVAGQAVTSSLEEAGTALRLPLPAPLDPGEAITLTLRFTTTVGSAGGGYGILTQAGGVITLGSWFPLLALHDGSDWRVPAIPVVGDAASTDIALFTLDLVAPADLQIAGTGEAAGAPVPVAEGGESSFVRWRFVSGPARELALAASPAWVPLAAEVDGVRVRYFPAPGTTHAAVSAQQALQLVVGALRAFGDSFGPPPYRELDVVEAEVRIGGYEYPGLVLFDARQRVANNLDYVRFLLAHEVAHQWFYALVGNNVTAEPWLDESLTTYATLLDTRITRGEPAAGALRRQWEEEYAADLSKRPVGVDQPVYAFRTWRAYRGPVYYAGALMLDDLRHELGDERYFAALRGYVNTFAFRRAASSDLMGAFEQAAGRDLRPFFQRWFIAAD